MTAPSVLRSVARSHTTGRSWSDLTLSPRSIATLRRRYRPRIKPSGHRISGPVHDPLVRLPRDPDRLGNMAELQHRRNRRRSALRRARKLESDVHRHRAQAGGDQHVDLHGDRDRVVFVLAMSLAALLNRYRAGGNFFKLALYFPLLAPPVLAAIDLVLPGPLRLRHFQFDPAHRLRGEGINFLGATPTLSSPLSESRSGGVSGSGSSSSWPGCRPYPASCSTRPGSTALAASAAS